MNSPPDCAVQVEDIQRHLAACETLAAHYREVLRGALEPATQVSSTLDHRFRPAVVQGSALVPAPPAGTCQASPVGDGAVPTRRSSKWPDMMRQRRAVSQQEHAPRSMNRNTSSRSEQGASLQQPFGSASPDQRLLPRGSPASRPLSSVQEDGDLPDVGITPEVYLAKKWFDEQSYLAMTRTNPSPSVAYSSPGPSACPSIISGSSVVDLSQPLTRHSSSLDSHPGAKMLRYFSSQSWQTDGSAGTDTRLASAAAFDVTNGPKKRSICDQDFFGVGAGFPPYTLLAPLPCTNLGLPTAAATSMERCISDASDASAKSAGSNLERRSKQAFQRVRRNSDRNLIAPKPHEAAVDRSHSSIAPSKRDGKVALQKTPYQRPKHPRVYCTQCDEHLDGFRGDHELRRHLNAKHKGVVKKFVCRDPASVGIQSKVKALYPLSECRACTSRKQYGAYYNAAAHLRRTHFKPRAPRGKNKVPTDERRGGKGGGDWPPMCDLKLWYEEVLVASDANTPDDAFDMVDDDSFEHGDDVTMDMFPELESGPPAYGVENTYGLPRSGTVEGHRLQDAAGGASISAAAASSAVSMNYFGFGEMPGAERPTHEYSFSGDGKLAYGTVASSLNSDMAAHFGDANSHVMTDYLWNIDGVEGPIS
ncbi:hypothetical protein G6O67_004838 [Ophiocordyceps sinensis]|uniref:DUF7896 domain-containing protein n=1 Tax=Ophiocordyceps sinensis TaxID=72228 RepID=A0A8H4PQB0_9HYPO|nr:hypothetical protein G6O67_004838 [Ophiocordyceps sinensis]